MYEPDSESWLHALLWISTADLPEDVKRRAYDWCYGLLDDPRPFPAIPDAAFLEMHEMELFDGWIPRTNLDVRWIVDEANKEFAIVRITRRLDLS